MPPMKQLRLWHAMVAILATSAYLTGEVEPVHQWLGYAVAALIVIRLLMALFGAGALGLQRFYPYFRDLKLGSLATHPAISRVLLLAIGISLLGVAGTGILMDRGQALADIPTAISSPAQASERGEDDHDDRRRYGGERGERQENEALEEVHEFFGNMLLAAVGLHVLYLVLFKWPLARFMLFVRQPKRVQKAG